MKDSPYSRPRMAGPVAVLFAGSLTFVTACLFDGPVSSELEAICAQFDVVDLDSIVPDTVGIDDTLLLNVQTSPECFAAPATRFLWSSSDETKAVVEVAPGSRDTAAVVRGVALGDGADSAQIEIVTRLVAPDLDTGIAVVHPVTIVPKLILGDITHPTSGEVIDTSLDIGAEFDIVAQVHNSVGRLERAFNRIELQLGFRSTDGTFVPVFDFGEDATGTKSGTFLSGSVDADADRGEAPFRKLKILTPGIGYQLRARSGGLTKATSKPFDIGFVRPEFLVQPTNAVAGDPLAPTVTVRALDENGAPVADSLSDAILELDNGVTQQRKTLDVRNMQNGLATFDGLSVCSAGDGHRLIVTLTTVGSLSDTSDPFDITVGPADVDSSTATVPMNGNVVEETTIQLRAFDQCGNDRGEDADTFLVSITGANTATGTVMNLGGNSYQATYQPTRRGQDFVTVTLNGDPLSGGPYTSTVGSGGLASETTADVPQSGRAGDSTIVSIVVRDKNGDQVPVGGDAVVVQVTGANDANAAVVDSGNGAYSASYIPTTVGTDVVRISLNGIQIQDSVSTSIVTAGVADPNNSTATVPGGQALTPTNITVIVNDAFDNRVSGAAVAITVSGANTATLTVSDDGNGNYSGSYTPTNSGTDQVEILVNGSPLSGSPFTSTVTQAAVQPE